MLLAALPGSTYRRLPLWRCLVEWTAPLDLDHPVALPKPR
jgi:hypothetical protein